MRKPTFAFSGILKIREYREMIAMQEFIKETRGDRELAFQYNELEKNILQLYNEQEQVHDIENIQYIFKYIAQSKNLQLEILAKRDALKEITEKAKEKYNKARVELESVKILHNKHVKEQKKIENKIQLNEIQENLLCD